MDRLEVNAKIVCQLWGAVCWLPLKGGEAFKKFIFKFFYLGIL
jgi:hypothetical protein